MRGGGRAAGGGRRDEKSRPLVAKTYDADNGSYATLPVVFLEWPRRRTYAGEDMPFLVIFSIGGNPEDDKSKTRPVVVVAKKAILIDNFEVPSHVITFISTNHTCSCKLYGHLQDQQEGHRLVPAPCSHLAQEIQLLPRRGDRKTVSLL